MNSFLEEIIMSKLRVWWIPQVGTEQTFYIPVNSVEEGKKMIDVLAAYDAFQYQNRVKPDYCNVGGLQMFDELEGEWNDWYLETDDDYFDDVDKYCESDSCDQKEELELFSKSVMEQVDWKEVMTR